MTVPPFTNGQRRAEKCQPGTAASRFGQELAELFPGLLQNRQGVKPGRRKPTPRGIAGRDRSAGPYPAQHPTFEWRARFTRREHLPFQARLETVDEDTRRPEAGQL